MLHPWSALPGACDTVGQVTQLAIVKMANLNPCHLTSDNSIMHAIALNCIAISHS